MTACVGVLLGAGAVWSLAHLRERASDESSSRDREFRLQDKTYQDLSTAHLKAVQRELPELPELAPCSKAICRDGQP